MIRPGQAGPLVTFTAALNSVEIDINALWIETYYLTTSGEQVGETRINMVSGTAIYVKESPAEIRAKLIATFGKLD